MTLGAFLWKYIERFDKQAMNANLEALSKAVAKAASDQKAANDRIINRVGEIMARIDDRSAEIGAKLDASTAQQTKALGEIRAALDKALESQITPEELAAAVEEAKRITRDTVQAENDAAIDRAFADLTAKAEASKAASQELDDIVPDEQPGEPTE
jgi:hypothetical protein